MIEMKSSKRDIALIHSYLSMRRMVGILAIGLPFIIVLGGLVETGSIIQGSLSSYYYTNMRDFLVGLIFAVAIFLISYKGYELIDDIVTNLSGVFALGIIAYPTSMFSNQVVRVGVFQTPDDVSQYIHLVFSILFLLSLAFNSIFLFTRHSGNPSREKKKRNKIYASCGIVMVLSVIGMVTYIVFYSHTFLAKGRPVLIFETIALISFGVSWLVKGHTLFRDKTA